MKALDSIESVIFYEIHSNVFMLVTRSDLSYFASDLTMPLASSSTIWARWGLSHAKGPAAKVVRSLNEGYSQKNAHPRSLCTLIEISVSHPSQTPPVDWSFTAYGSARFLPPLERMGLFIGAFLVN